MGQPARKFATVSATGPQGSAVGVASLISPVWDTLLIGGGSVLLAMLMSVSLKRESPEPSISWLVFYLSFGVNFPHFLVSYQMLYYDFRGEILKNLRFFWAAIIVPLVLIGGMATCFALSAPKELGYFVNAMYFFVGWHYVKQIFGGISVTNAMNKFFYSKMERWALKTNLFSLWGISYFAQNIGSPTYSHEGITYSSLNLPPELLQIALGVCVVSGAAVVATHIQKYIRDGRTPAPAAIACFVTIYAWYLPAFYQPMFFHMIPFFHSLQYLMFVYAFRRNKVEAHIDQPHTEAGRRQWIYGVFGYLTVPVITGALAFWYVPKFLDAHQMADPTLFGPTAAMFCATIFINIHHYFIDNVLWRGNNPEMKKYLFRTAA